MLLLALMLIIVSETLPAENTEKVRADIKERTTIPNTIIFFSFFIFYLLLIKN